MSEESDLDVALCDAHAANDLARLARLYARASELAADEVDAVCFFLTQAWVFAMAADLDEAEALHDRLAAHGRV